MVNKLVVAYIGDHCSQFLDMTFESVEGADNIIFIWGTEDPKTEEKLREWQKKIPGWIRLIYNKFDQEDPGMNGKARNVYLDILKKEFPDDYCLVLDPDECLTDGGIKAIKAFLKKNALV